METTYIVTPTSGGQQQQHHEYYSNQPQQHQHSPVSILLHPGEHQGDQQQTHLGLGQDTGAGDKPGRDQDRSQPDTGEHRQQMLEVCSPVVSSTSHPEMKIAMRGGGVVNYNTGGRVTVQQENNIGSIITMLIDDQGADLDEILTDNRDHRSQECRDRLETNNVQIHQQQHPDIKEEGCMSDQLNMTEYPRQYPSPDYYYQRDYVPQENVTDKDIETRSSLSSNSEGDDIEMCRYSRNGYNTAGVGSVMSPSNMMSSSPYILSRDNGQSINQPGQKKDDKYWERRRKNNLAAKKSRDARRVRENQLRLRVLCLENANRVLREQMDRKEVELVQLRERLSKYEAVPQPSGEHNISMANM